MMELEEFAQQVGCSPELIRHYEKLSLLDRPKSRLLERPLYSVKDHDRVCLIRQARFMGFDLTALKELLLLADQPDKDPYLPGQLANLHLERLEGRIELMSALAEELRILAQKKMRVEGQNSAEQIIQALRERAALYQADWPRWEKDEMEASEEE